MPLPALIPLGDLVSVRGGGTPDTKIDSYWRGDIPWVSPKDMKSDDVGSSQDNVTPEALANSAASLIPQGSILVVVRSGILARTVPVARTTRPLAINQDIKALVPSGRLDTRYLHYFLKASESLLLERVSKGATVHRLSTDDLRKLLIPLTSLAEQKRIVADLDEAFRGIDAIIAVVEAQLEQDRELRLATLTDSLPRLGSVVTLAEQVEMLVGFAFKSSDYVNDPNSVRLLRGDNVIPGAIRWADAKALSKDVASEFGRYQLAVDDVVVAMDRPWIKAGLKQARLTEKDVPSLLVQRVARLRCRPSLKVGYLQHLIASPLFERHVLDHAAGSGVPHISGGQLGAFSFTLPAIEDQAAIVDRLDALQVSYSALARIRLQKLAALAELKQSLLARAFTGKLTSEPLAA
ncbi:restriction endonuclease subunit S [Aquidulcibacter paucihalophilus]|nr:restriction endonuclease subunit S [Aquidulcibacter paucihalophilus]